MAAAFAHDVAVWGRGEAALLSHATVCLAGLGVYFEIIEEAEFQFSRRPARWHFDPDRRRALVAIGGERWAREALVPMLASVLAYERYARGGAGLAYRSELERQLAADFLGEK